MPLIFWLTLLRGAIAITMGTIMLVYPVKSPAMLVNFMGMFWLMSGIVSVRWSMIDFRHRRVALAAGAIATLTSAFVLSRSYTVTLMQEYFFLVTLGVVILLIGLLHLFGGFRTHAQHREQQQIPSFALGIFEVILGSLLIVRPLERGPLVYYSACIWALLCGLVLIGDALALRRARLKQGHAAIH